MTRIIVPITAPTAEQARLDAAEAYRRGADGIELRLDLMPGVSEADLMALLGDLADPTRRVILTARSRAEGGQDDRPPQERAAQLCALGPYADIIDCEFSLWHSSPAVRRTLIAAAGRARRVDRAGSAEIIEHDGRRLLMLSRHWPAGRPPTLSADVAAMIETPECDLVKVAWTARSVRDGFEAFDLLRESPKPMIALCMGEAGLLTRVLSGKLGAFATFAALDAGRTTAAGQLSLDEMRDTYRVHAQSAQTAVYGVAGWPVSHSLGPALHNAAFAAHGLDAVYAPLPVAPGYESLKAFVVEALARPWLNLRGLSITAPHKEHALRLAQELCRADAGGESRLPASAAVADEVSLRIGAANTLIIEPSGRVAARNTDADAALASLTAAMGVQPAALAGRPVSILGAGGVARACVAALCRVGAAVTVFARDAQRGAALAAAFGAGCRPWDNRPGSPEIVINCTPVGQSPQDGETPLDAAALAPPVVVFDTVYRPETTRLVREARQRGCLAFGGLDMFLRQAAAQYAHWTGREPPADFRYRLKNVLPL